MKRIGKITVKVNWLGLAAMGLSIAATILNECVQNKRMEALITDKINQKLLKSRNK